MKDFGRRRREQKEKHETMQAKCITFLPVVSWYRCFLCEALKPEVSDFLLKIQSIDKFFILVQLETFGEMNLSYSLSPHQLSLRMSKQPTVGSLAGPSSLRHGDHLQPPSRSPRSATGCSRAPWGGLSVQRMNCKQQRGQRRKVPLSRHRLPVLLLTQYGFKGDFRHGRLRLARLVKTV